LGTRLKQYPFFATLGTRLKQYPFSQFWERAWNNTLSWDITSYSLAEINQRFGGNFCLYDHWPKFYLFLFFPFLSPLSDPTEGSALSKM
jgi:hypothetical protein